MLVVCFVVCGFCSVVVSGLFCLLVLLVLALLFYVVGWLCCCFCLVWSCLCMCCCCAGRIFPGLLVLSCFVAVCVFACF